MKINSVVFNSFNRVQIKPNQSEDVSKMDAKPQWEGISSAHMSYPIAKPVSFGWHFFTKLKNAPCACCNGKMVTAEEFAELTESILLQTSRHVVKSLEPFEKNMHAVEKECFGKIREASKTFPNRDLKEILRLLRPEHLKRLKLNQFKVLDKIDGMSNDLSIDSALKLREITTRARFIIMEDDNESPFKRKPLLAEISSLQDILPEKNIAKKIGEAMNDLPSSSNDVSAFIVKYSKRSSREIGQRLVSPSVVTVEHINPQNPLEGLAKGENNPKNYLLECARCNSKRGNIPLDEWVSIHCPDMIKNVQKYIDFIIDKINAKLLIGYEHYPEDVSETLDTASKGLITLDTSRLKSFEKDNLVGKSS